MAKFHHRRPYFWPATGSAALILTGCKPAVLDPGGPIGLAEKAILADSLAIMLAIVLPALAAIFGFVWWFRASNPKATYRPDWSYSGRIELIVWSVPLLVTLLVGGVAWIGSHELDPGKPLESNAAPLEVQVVSLDWKWLFIYPNHHIASVGQLVIPAGVPIYFSLTSASVMNAFFVPRLGSMIYTMNRMTTELNLRADEPGTFSGISSHFSGDGFSDMNFEVLAVTQDQFEIWTERTRATGPELDKVGYAALAKQSSSVGVSTYRLTEPRLFQEIVAQTLPPGPGPDPARRQY